MKCLLNRIVLLSISILFSCLSSKSQTYIPIKDKSSQKITAIFNYSYSDGANRPSADIIFKDGYSFYLNAVCTQTAPDGTSYEWCVRNRKNEDIAYMTFKRSKRQGVIEIKILHNNLSGKYLQYLNVFRGIYVEANGVRQQIPFKGVIN